MNQTIMFGALLPVVYTASGEAIPPLAISSVLVNPMTGFFSNEATTASNFVWSSPASFAISRCRINAVVLNVLLFCCRSSVLSPRCALSQAFPDDLYKFFLTHIDTSARQFILLFY